jgi:hypothetical protein
MAGAPLGNQNAARAKIWRAAIMRALERRQPADQRVKAIDELADKLIDLVASGDLGALKEFGDRLDGKPAQAIIGGDDDDPPLRVARIELVPLSKEGPT